MSEQLTTGIYEVKVKETYIYRIQADSADEAIDKVLNEGDYDETSFITNELVSVTFVEAVPSEDESSLIRGVSYIVGTNDDKTAVERLTELFKKRLQDDPRTQP